MENNQRSPTWEAADILKMSKSIELLVKIKNVSLFYGKTHMDFLANPILNTQYQLLLLLF